MSKKKRQRSKNGGASNGKLSKANGSKAHQNGGNSPAQHGQGGASKKSLREALASWGPDHWSAFFTGLGVLYPILAAVVVLVAFSVFGIRCGAAESSAEPARMVVDIRSISMTPNPPVGNEPWKMSWQIKNIGGRIATGVQASFYTQVSERTIAIPLDLRKEPYVCRNRLSELDGDFSKLDIAPGDHASTHYVDQPFLPVWVAALQAGRLHWFMHGLMRYHDGDRMVCRRACFQYDPVYGGGPALFSYCRYNEEADESVCDKEFAKVEALAGMPPLGPDECPREIEQ